MKRTVQSVLMLVALWGALLTIALHKGWDMPRWLSPEERKAETLRAQGEHRGSDATPSSVADAGATDPIPVQPASDVATDNASPWPRYRVCASGAPKLSLIQLDERTRAVAVHCGDRVHLVHVAEQGTPTRIAALSLPTANPAEHLVATSLVSADANADGLNDLLLPVLTTDSWQHPRGRHVLLVARDASGSFRSGQRLLAGSPLGLIAGAIDGVAGADFVVLHAVNESLKKPREAWWFLGGSTPRRAATTPLAAGTDQLVLADLDLDQHLDLIALSPAESVIHVAFGKGDGTAAAAIEVKPAACEELLVADLSGDARGDVLCIGASSLVLEGAPTRELSPRPLSLAGERPRSLHTADLNADGKLDLVGYAHPQVVRLEQTSAGAFEPRMVAELRGTTFAPLDVVLVDIDRDDVLDAVMLGNSPSDESAIDLVIVRDIHRSTVLTVSDETITLPDAPLLLTPALQ